MARNRRRRILRAVLIAISLLGVVFIGACTMAAYHLWSVSQPRFLELQELSSITRVTLPKSVRLVGAFREPMGLDYAIYAKVLIKREDVEWFMKNGLSNVTEAPAEFRKDFEMPYDWKPSHKDAIKWWKPDSVHDGLGASWWYGTRGIDLLIDRKGDKWATVYILLIQT